MTTAEPKSSEPAAPEPGSVREFLKVAVPLILSAGSLAIMNVIDRLLLTWYDTDAMAAALPAGMVHWTILSIPIGIVLYVNTFVAQYDGAGQPKRVVASVWQGFFIAVVSGLALLPLIPFAPQIFAATGHDPHVVDLEVQYFATLCWGSLAFTLASSFSCFFMGRRATHIVMWVNVASVFVNFLVDYLLIFGKGPFPELGIVGAAWGTVAARVVASVAYFVLMKWFNNHEVHDFRGLPKLDITLLKRLLRFGIPNGINSFVDIFGFTVFVLLIGSIGPQELAATSLAFNLNTLAFFPLFGFGMAVSTLVGNRVGEGRPDIAEKTTWAAFRTASCWMSFFMIVYLIAPDFVLNIYSTYSADGDFEEVRDQVVVLLRFVSAYCFFDGMAIVFSSAVRGAGDTRFPMLVSLIGCWCIMVLPTAIMNHYGGNLLGSWAACTAYIVAIGFTMLYRFQTGKWKSMKVIEPTPADEESEELVETKAAE
ncbi:MAG: MATE family efflux transporter [Planctomycetaceae bacterium]